MPKLSPRLLFACTLALTMLAAPAGAETYYSWVTKDGVHSYTDDPKAVPALYKKDARRRSSEALAGYGRFTPNDVAASDRYAQRLAARLDHLRRLNGAAPAPEGTRAAQPGTAPAISLRTGGERDPILDVTPNGSGDPIIVETLRARRANGLVTRNNVVVRQGDRTIAIVRSRGREWNVAEDIHVEDDLER
jgi:hypothetical protein